MSMNQAMDQTAADPDYTVRLLVGAGPERVFAALTDNDALAAWWTAVSGDGRTGGTLTFQFGDQSHAVMRVDTADAAGVVTWTCVDCMLPDWIGTTLQFEFRPIASQYTELQFQHRGLTPALSCFAECKSGWDHFIPSLRAYLETGSGQPNQSPADMARREVRPREAAAS